jgi:DNA replication protein DnaC
LVLSFHGATGTGKNYVSTLIANSLYKNGINSKFVQIFVASRDFTHTHHIDKYRVSRFRVDLN